MGDAEDPEESDLVSRWGAGLRADLLKVCHHGSKTSNAPAFLRAVSPRYAVICVGIDNPYGHPYPGTLARFQSLSITVYRTDEDGTVVFISDGKQFEKVS